MMRDMPRKYEQSKRAEQQEETRRRIVRAAVDLHELVGPARTSVSAVAERAGVQRNTFYRHFPDDSTLIRACSSLFDSEHPLPDPRRWSTEPDPVRRVEIALTEVYGYWGEHEQMIGNVLRDAETDELVRTVAEESWGTALDAMREVLVDGWPEEARSPELTAMVDLALSFRTWQSLVRRSGLDVPAAAGTMSRSLAAVPA